MKKLTFIIPVISKEIVSNWQLVMENLRRTMASVKNQTSDNWQVIMVSQTKPDISFNDERIMFFQADFPPAQKYPKDMKLSTVKKCVIRRANDLDRVKKIRVAASKLHENKTNFVMLLEADDVVSNKLCEFIESNPESNGWYFENGYIWHARFEYMLRADQFWRQSGSSWVVKVFYETLPQDMPLDIDPTNLCLVNSGCPFLDNGHRRMASGMEKIGKPITPIASEFVICVRGHGANLSHPQNKYVHAFLPRKFRHWRRKLLFDLKNRRKRAYFTNEIMSEFGMNNVL